MVQSGRLSRPELETVNSGLDLDFSLNKFGWRANLEFLEPYSSVYFAGACNEHGAVAMFAFSLMTGAVVKDMLDLLAEGHLTIPIFLRLVQLRFRFAGIRFAVGLHRHFYIGVCLPKAKLRL